MTGLAVARSCSWSSFLDPRHPNHRRPTLPLSLCFSLFFSLMYIRVRVFPFFFFLHLFLSRCSSTSFLIFLPFPLRCLFPHSSFLSTSPFSFSVAAFFLSLFLFSEHLSFFLTCLSPLFLFLYLFGASSLFLSLKCIFTPLCPFNAYHQSLYISPILSCVSSLSSSVPLSLQRARARVCVCLYVAT